jgi:hypothetical protein
LGETDDKKAQLKLEEEAQHYGDIVQVRALSFLVVFHNLLHIVLKEGTGKVCTYFDE